MKNRYELTIKIEGGTGKRKGISDPFKEKTKEEEKLDKYLSKTTKSLALSSGIAVVRGFTGTLGNSHINQQIELVKSTYDMAMQTAVAGIAFGGIGVVMSLLSTLPSMISGAISYNQGMTWDNIEQNKSIRRAGPEFNRSRF